MIISLPFYLQIPELRNLRSKRSEVLREQQKLLEFLSNPNKFENLVISLRYVYDPTKEPNHRLKIYLSINHIEGDVQKVQSALDIITKGSLRDFYKFQFLSSQPNLIHKLESWVDVIGEIIKDEKFPSNQGYYIPYLIQPNPDNDMLSVCKQLQSLDKRLIIEFTLKTCSDCDKESIKTTIKQIFRGINQDSSRYYSTHLSINEIDIARDISNQYLNSYVTSDRNLFKYSIKILAESSYDIDLVVKALMQNALKDDNYGQRYQEIILKRGTEEFNKSLRATKRVELFTDIERREWKSGFEQQLIKGIYRSQNSHRHIIRLPETEALQDDRNFLPSTGELAKVNDSWSLGKYFETSPDSSNTSNSPSALKLLHRVVTPQEISSLFRIVVSGDVPVPGIAQEQPSFNKPTAEKIFRKYSHLITNDKDRYIVGIDDYNNLLLSSWRETPHRLVAGITKSGKTNFLHWIIFQFLYADSKRKVYIFDFKKINFEFYNDIKALQQKVEIVTEVENCYSKLEAIYKHEYKARQDICRQNRVQNIEQLEVMGTYLPRLLIVVDEAASIPIECDDILSNIPLQEQYKFPHLKNLQNTIERRLQDFATKGAALGIHLIYCTQSPKQGLISSQVTTQLGDRIAFRVKMDVGNSVLGDKLLNMAAKIPDGDRGRGRAFLEGSETTGYVNTPEIKVPPMTPLEDTLWSQL